MSTDTSSILVIAFASIALAACAGGSSGGGFTAPSMTASTGATASTSSSATPVSACCWEDTGVSGSVGVPIAASLGSSPVAPVLADPGGPTFGAANGTFPLLFTGFQATPSGLTPIAPGQGATITVMTGAMATRGAVSWQISVPSANVNSAGWGSVSLVNDFDSPVQALNYVALGFWITRAGPQDTGLWQTAGHFIFGYQTPAASMPASGAATFTGFTQAQVFQPVSGQTIQSNWLFGNASFSVDFSAGKVSGAFTGISDGNRQPWNDVSVTAAIASASNRFGGTTAVTSSPTGSFSLKPSATGSISGAFFGPAAQQLGAVWTLSDGTTSALGTVTSGH